MLRGGLQGILRASVPVVMFVCVRRIGPSPFVGTPAAVGRFKQRRRSVAQPGCVVWTRVLQTGPTALGWFTRRRRPPPGPAYVPYRYAPDRPRVAARLTQTPEPRPPCR